MNTPNENKIEVGDLVKFTFCEPKKYIQGKILELPTKENNFFLVRQYRNGKDYGIVLINNFDTCLLLKKEK